MVAIRTGSQHDHLAPAARPTDRATIAPLGFTPGRAQDAASTIAGFRYQLQLTLQRWLELGEAEVLWLEHGEDIDRVFASARGQATQRELEQVKVRRRRLTLRSPELLSSLAHFAEHLEANRGLALCFRFTTTAEPACERSSPLPTGLSGIRAWQNLQRSACLSDLEHDTAQKIIDLCSKARRPRNCSSKAWQALTGIWARTSVIDPLSFIQRVELSCGSSPSDHLSELLVDQIAVRVGSPDTTSKFPDDTYCYLMTYLFDVLSGEGDKTLTAPLLRDVLADYENGTKQLMRKWGPLLRDFDQQLPEVQAFWHRWFSIGIPDALWAESTSLVQRLCQSGLVKESARLAAATLRQASTMGGREKAAQDAFDVLVPQLRRVPPSSRGPMESECLVLAAEFGLLNCEDSRQTLSLARDAFAAYRHLADQAPAAAGVIALRVGKIRDKFRRGQARQLVRFAVRSLTKAGGSGIGEALCVLSSLVNESMESDVRELACRRSARFHRGRPLTKKSCLELDLQANHAAQHAWEASFLMHGGELDAAQVAMGLAVSIAREVGENDVEVATFLYQAAYLEQAMGRPAMADGFLAEAEQLGSQVRSNPSTANCAGLWAVDQYLCQWFESEHYFGTGHWLDWWVEMDEALTSKG